MHSCSAMDRHTVCNTRCSILSRFSHFHVSHFTPLQHGAAFLCPASSCLAFSASPHWQVATTWSMFYANRPFLVSCFNLRRLTGDAAGGGVIRMRCLMQVDDILAFYGWLFQSKVADWRGCRGDGISIPIPIPYPQKIPQDPHTHRTLKSYIPIPSPCLFTTRGLF